MSAPEQQPLVPLIDVLESIGDILDAELQRREEQLELIAVGENHAHPALVMALHAECASRGIDWRDLLAASVHRALNTGQRH